MSQRFDRHGHPIPPSREERARWMPLLTGLILLAGTLLVGLALLTESRTPVPARASRPTTPSAIADPALSSIAAALQTMAAPTPTRTPSPTPEPTSARLPTAVVIHCGMGSGWDDVCVWPPPTPTPEPSTPVCLTPAPGLECRWRGWVTPTPAIPQWPANVASEGA